MHYLQVTTALWNEKNFELKTFKVLNSMKVLYDVAQIAILELSRKINKFWEVSLKSAILKYHSETIPITFYGSYGDQLVEVKCYVLKKFQVNRYLQKRQLRQR